MLHKNILQHISTNHELFTESDVSTCGVIWQVALIRSGAIIAQFLRNNSSSLTWNQYMRVPTYRKWFCSYELDNMTTIVAELFQPFSRRFHCSQIGHCLVGDCHYGAPLDSQSQAHVRSFLAVITFWPCEAIRS